MEALGQNSHEGGLRRFTEVLYPDLLRQPHGSSLQSGFGDCTKQDAAHFYEFCAMKLVY